MEEITQIKPTKGLVKINFKELWEYRELLWVLVERDIRVRYKQTVIGGIWALLQPFLTMVVFTIFFSRLGGSFSGDTPYPFFAYSGLILWTYFTNAISSASLSMIDNCFLISRVYVPKVFIPVTATLTPGLDYLIASGLLFGFATYYHLAVRWEWLFIPLVWGLTWMLATGVGFWLSSLNVKYRDVRYALPFFIQLMIFITPVIYPLSSVGKFNFLLKLNPMSSLVELHRAIILSTTIDWGLMVYGLGVTLVLFISGLLYFKSVEKYFADKL
ncbi:MAG: ABC transporter permease [Candidatus Beckwithbacteria bacterium]